MNNKNGKFIVLEGGDKSGKSTQIKLLQEYMEKNSFDYIITREPGGKDSVIAEKIREIILNKNHSEMDNRAELLLYLASRAQHVTEVVKPALDEGKTVICDRFDTSTFAYQGAARKIDFKEIKLMNSWAKYGLEPDLIIYLDITPEQAEARNRDDKHDRLDQETKEFHQAVRLGYLKQADENSKMHVISAIGKIQDIAINIQEKIKEIIK